LEEFTKFLGYQKFEKEKAKILLYKMGITLLSIKEK
jgi:hypothetical protein